MINSNMCKKWMSSDVGLLVLRLALGGIFVLHGYAKFASMDQTKAFFIMFHIPVFLAYVVAFFELLCGLLVILGMFTWFAGVVLSVIMVFAVALVKSKFPISMAEIDIMIFASALAVAFVGPGRFVLNPCKFCKCGGKCFFCKYNGMTCDSNKAGCPTCSHVCTGGVCDCKAGGCVSCNCGVEKENTM